MSEDFLDPKSIIRDYLKPQPGMVAVDFGCGSGGWSIPLSEALEGGKVYAVDILEEPLSALRSKMNARRIFNIEIVKMDIEKTILRFMPNSVNIVLLSNVLFQVKDKKKVLEEAKRILAPGGTMLIIDWEKDSAIGPETRISAEEMRSLADQAGFIFDQSFKAGSHHYGMTFKKTQPTNPKQV
jgi:ubiquinone/menaquinone biosynthesis C-methylase UbiE